MGRSSRRWDAGGAPKVATICTQFGLPEETVRASFHDPEGGIIIAMQNPQHLRLHEFMGQQLPAHSALPEPGEIFYARPFANFANHHRIFVDDEQKWYGECPVESVTTSCFFPGKDVRVESVCQQTGGSVTVTGRDGVLLDYQPKSLRIYWGKPLGQWLSTKRHEGDFIAPCAENYFFSSEDAYEAWRKTHPREPGQIFTPVQIHHLLRLFNYGHERFDFQYHFPVLRLLAASVTAGLFRWRMLVPIPNRFFLSMGKFLRDVYRDNHKLFLDVKPW